jgi:kanamycin kinase
VLPTVSRLERRKEATLVRPLSPAPGALGRRLVCRGRPAHAAWVNEQGGITFRVGVGFSSAEFIKVANADVADFAGEAERLRWAARYVTVPHVLGSGLNQGQDGHCAWLRTRALPGLSAVHPRWLAAPDVAVRAIGAGLRSVAAPSGRSSRCGHALSSGRWPAGWPSYRRPPGRAWAGGGRCCGHVDFGELGVADRWADLAVATLSLRWNYPGRRWGAEFFAAYGVEPDPARIDYYRRLWQAEDAASR